MLRDNVRKIVERYIDRYPFADEDQDVVCGSWLDVVRFWDTWDDGIPDFVSMFQQAVGEPSDNLIDGGITRSTEGITELCGYSEEMEHRVQKEFRKLNSYEEDVEERQKRMDAFRDNINGMLKTIGKHTNKLKQDTHAGMMYLALLQPEENYMFHPSDAALFAQYIDLDGKIGNGKTFKLKEYYHMCDEVQKVLADHPEFLEKVKEELNKNTSSDSLVKILEKDPQNHILVYDVIHRANAEKLYYTERIPAPEKGYTEEDVRRIRMDDEKEVIKKDIKKLGEELEMIKKDEKAIQYPDLRGMTISVKKKIGHGRVEGTIIGCDGNMLEIQLPDRTAKYSVSAMVSGILKLENAEMAEAFRQKEIFDKMYAKLEKEKIQKEKKLKMLES